jgi:type II restriction enzyme
MAQKDRLRLNRYGTVINLTSSQQETELGRAVLEVSEVITGKFGFALNHSKRVMLSDIVGKLRKAYPGVPFADPFATSSMNPDGGILSLIGSDGTLFPILIAEAKNQGTNDLRAAEGLAKQAKGNAIERLGKNVIGFRTMLLEEGIVPFVCFGYGIDFDDDSSILDRVRTIAMFGPLNEICVVNIGDDGRFNRGSFFFRRAAWSKDEMVSVMNEVATRAVHYYMAKHGESGFRMIDQ